MGKAVIFDMDGVLVDSQPLHFKVDMEVLRQCGAPVTFTDVEKYAGVANKDRWPRYRDAFRLEKSVDELIAIHTEILMKLFREGELNAMPGMPELLKLLRFHSVKTAVASSSSLALIELVLERLGFTEYFDEVVTGEDVENGKPSPDVFLKAAEKLGAAAADCVVVEDSTSGVLAAYRAHMRCVGYRNPHSGKQDLSKATMVIDDFGEINGNLSWMR